MFDQVMARFAGRFGRVEPKASARAYLLGLLPEAERKNCWQLAAGSWPNRPGQARPGSMQRLLRYARWDADATIHPAGVIRHRTGSAAAAATRSGLGLGRGLARVKDDSLVENAAGE
ncbi:hypothetical protein ACIQ6Y_32845 [Streptomyces sp. NPDC096205]|uniref:hypothetical protein n=1 Tax=Streptomyces sp. NPDC096205 TaxID=3366081 RepID=UPI00382FBBFE